MVRATGRIGATLSARIVEPIVRYFRETRAELRKVSWPTRQTAWHLTLIVLGATVAMAIVLGVFADTLFYEIIGGIVGRGDQGASPIAILAALIIVGGGAAAAYFVQRE